MFEKFRLLPIISKRWQVASCAAALAISLCTLASEAKTHHHSPHSSHTSRSSHSAHSRSSHSSRHSSRHSNSRHHRIAINNGESGIEPPPVSNPNVSANVSAYQLYDHGVNQELNGDFASAMTSLTRSSQLLHGENQPSTLQMMVDMELGKTAESANNEAVAKDAYASCIKNSPQCVDAYIRLSQLLIEGGDPLSALERAKECVQACPNSARACALYADVLSKNGFDDDARVQEDRSKALLNQGTANPR